MKLVALAVSLATLASCDPCEGPPPMPYVDAAITFEVAPSADQYLQLEMLNAHGEHLEYSPWFTPDEFAQQMPFVYSMGHCDEIMQVSGAFTLRAWLSLSPYSKTPEPADPQGATLFDVSCTETTGCIAEIDSVPVTVRAP
jgi:hypothetical protein